MNTAEAGSVGSVWMKVLPEIPARQRREGGVINMGLNNNKQQIININHTSEEHIERVGGKKGEGGVGLRERD